MRRGLFALADGVWREDALAFERVFLFFDDGGIDDARAAWRALGEQKGHRTPLLEAGRRTLERRPVAPSLDH